MENKISIIVPIYNKEVYIERALKSIINQTYKNIEIILIDDGSTDNSKKICQKYIEKYSNIKYIYKENGGVASARNRGLQEATGKYIGFVDPDDYVDVNMYYKMMKSNIDENDIISCGVKILDEENNKIRYFPNPEKKYMNSSEAVYHLLKWDGNVTPYLWNKLFKRTVINNIVFDEGLIVGEDMLFVFEVLCNIRSYLHIDEYLYSYMRNSNSLVGFGYKSNAALSSVKSSLIICEKCRKIYKNFIDESRYGLCLNCFFQINELLKCDEYKKYNEEYVYFKNHILNVDLEIIKKYDSGFIRYKIFLSIHFPKIYRYIVKIVN